MSIIGTNNVAVPLYYFVNTQPEEGDDINDLGKIVVRINTAQTKTGIDTSIIPRFFAPWCLQSGTYALINVDWGDGSEPSDVASTQSAAGFEHIYAQHGTYDVTLTGNTEGWARNVLQYSSNGTGSWAKENIAKMVTVETALVPLMFTADRSCQMVCKQWFGGAIVSANIHPNFILTDKFRFGRAWADVEDNVMYSETLYGMFYGNQYTEVPETFTIPDRLGCRGVSNFRLLFAGRPANLGVGGVRLNNSVFPTVTNTNVYHAAQVFYQSACPVPYDFLPEWTDPLNFTPGVQFLYHFMAWYSGVIPTGFRPLFDITAVPSDAFLYTFGNITTPQTVTAQSLVSPNDWATPPNIDLFYGSTGFPDYSSIPTRLR